MLADLAGFAAAQRRLRAQFGETAVFLQPPQFTYPSGTPIDPDTHRPYDPVIQPTASAQASAAVNVTVAFATANPEDEAPLGFVERTRVMLIADLADRARCEGAAAVVVREGRYQVTSMKPDGIGGLQRWLTFARLGA
jgi:hypothetical protein